MKLPYGFIRVAVCGLLPAAVAAAQSFRVKSNAGLMLRLNGATGIYAIQAERPDWTFAGELGHSVSNAAVRQGQDRIGTYREISFQWRAGIPLGGSIRVYDARPVALFSVTCQKAADTWPTPFPRFTTFPAGLHHFSFRDSYFAPPVFSLATNGTPWLLFNDQADAVLISPADDFMLASMQGDGAHEIASGLNPNVHDLPADYSHHTLIAFASGIQAVWRTWSRAFLAWQGRTPAANDADIGLRYLGYWTDNGAHYYYNFDPHLGYSGTLEKLVKRYRAEDMPIRYLQLDSWWYEKTLTSLDGKTGGTRNRNLPAGKWNRPGGLLKYQADPTVMPGGIAALHKATDLPLITHNRWIDPASPYHEHYKISGVGAVDPKWWDDIMNHIAAGGAVCYEQDWLNEIYAHSPKFQTTPGVGAAFTGNMSRAAKERGLSLQYCMATPRFFLQGSRYPNLTTIRVSDDRFQRSRWDHFLYVSQFAHAVGIWPWTDVFMSTETNNLLLADLSGGMVGIGDAIGHEDRANLMRVARPDGVLVKPDVPLLPLDQDYLAQARGNMNPMVAWTHSDHGGSRTAYIFAYRRRKGSSPAAFAPSALGLHGQVCVLDVGSGRARFESARKRVEIRLAAGGTAYCEVAPVGKSGLAFFGDAGKFVSNGRQRIAALAEAPGHLTVTVTFAAGEKSVALFGFADQAPRVTATRGSAGRVKFDPHTGRFTARVSPSATIVHNGPDPTQTAIVKFMVR